MIENLQPVATSAAQDSWVELAETVREKLHLRAYRIPLLDPKEVKELVNVISQAYWFDVLAHAFDAKVEKESNPNPFH